MQTQNPAELSQNRDNNPMRKPGGNRMSGESQAGQPAAGAEGAAAAEQKIVIDGKEMTVEEVKKGMMMQSEFTKKSQAVAEERKALEQEKLRLSGAMQLAEALETNPELDAEVSKVVEGFKRKTAGMSEGSMEKNQEVLKLEQRLAAIEAKEQQAVADAEMNRIVSNIESTLDKEGINSPSLRSLIKDSALVKIMQNGKDYAEPDKLAAFVSENAALLKDPKLAKLITLRPDATPAGDTGGRGGMQISPKDVPNTQTNAFKQYMKDVMKNLTTKT
jgi:hypothetical protein